MCRRSTSPVRNCSADRDELIGYPFENHVGTQDRAAFLKRFRKCCREHQVLNCDVGIVRKDGKSITAHLRGVPIESPGAEASFCKIAMADISERKAAEEALEGLGGQLPDGLQYGEQRYFRA